MRPKLGRKFVLRIFGIDAELHRETAHGDLVLLETQRQPGGDADLLLDDVDPGDALGDGVLDLDAGIHLHEIELAAASSRNSTVPAFS